MLRLIQPAFYIISFLPSHKIYTPISSRDIILKVMCIESICVCVSRTDMIRLNSAKIKEFIRGVLVYEEILKKTWTLISKNR